MPQSRPCFYDLSRFAGAAFRDRGHRSRQHITNKIRSNRPCFKRTATPHTVHTLHNILVFPFPPPCLHPASLIPKHSPWACVAAGQQPPLRAHKHCRRGRIRIPLREPHAHQLRRPIGVGTLLAVACASCDKGGRCMGCHELFQV